MTEREKMLAGKLYDIPAGVFAVGNPCRVVRPITQEDSVSNKKELF